MFVNTFLVLSFSAFFKVFCLKMRLKDLYCNFLFFLLELMKAGNFLLSVFCVKVKKKKNTEKSGR